MKGLFEDSGIPTYEGFISKLDLLKGPKCNVLANGMITYLPKKGTVVFIGDLHGDFEAVVSIIRQTDFLGAMARQEKMFLVFLGDYGDRGTKIIETINEVITLKLLYPENVVLLKGNHEEEEIAKGYGTYDVFIESYGREKGTSLFKLYCATMAYLPIVAITPNGIIGVHAGIPNSDISSIDILNSDLGESCAQEMIWNDPGEHVIGRTPNARGGFTMVFGKDVFDKFMRAVPANIMVRSHEYPRNGVDILFEGRLATIFSNGSDKSRSSAYKRHVERAVFLKTVLDKKKDKFKESDFIEIVY